MKPVIVTLGLFLLLVGSAQAQSLVAHPDSATAGQSQLQVTIVGTGTQFKASGNVSSFNMITVSINHSGIPVWSGNPWHVTTDTSMDLLVSIPVAAQTGWCDLRIVNTDQNHPFNYSASNAFFIRPAPAKLLSVSPSTGYDSQTVEVTIQGQNCGFDPDKSEPIDFRRGGSTLFTTHPDSVYSANKLTARVTIPVNAPSGYYDVRVDNPQDTFSGTQLFQILPGRAPSISAQPDTGAASTTFDVTIVGQNTKFQPTTSVSTLGLYFITLNSGQSVIVSTNPSSIASGSSMLFSLVLPDTLTAGTYDLRLSVPSDQPPTDAHTPFYVVPLNVLLPNGYSGHPNSVATVDLHAGGGRFLYYNGPSLLYVKDIKLIRGTTSIPGQNITVLTDTSLSADFTIPSGAPLGTYDLRIVEPGTGRVILKRKFFTIQTSGVEPDNNESGDIQSLTVSPNPSGGHVFIKFNLARTESVNLTIMDELGRTVSTLSQGMLQPGSKSFEWANDDAANGSYFYELVTGLTTRVGRVVVRRP